MDRLSPLDASFLHIEDDVNHMHIGSIGIFEGPPPAYEELTATVGGRLSLVPRYRQRIAKVPGGLANPVWVDDPDFDLTYHVRRSALPRPGSADQLFELDEKILSVIEKLKERGLVSPYLRAFVVARINPLRWIKDEPPPLPEVLRTMKERLAKFNVDKVNQQDLAKAGGAPDTES